MYVDPNVQVAEAWKEIDRLAKENEEIRRALERYRYVYHWWASHSYDMGGEFNARMNWARGEDVEQDLTPDQFAKIGHRFLEGTGRRQRIGTVAVPDDKKPA